MKKMSDKQLQKAGDNSQQIQAQNVYIENGISEQRVREICSEVASKAIADNTFEANDTAMQRIERFVDLLLPRIQRIEKDFSSFSDPAFQVLLRKAQLASACTERESDYSILSELLVHRVKNKSNIKKKASITKAVEIVDQIDDDSLAAITMFLSVETFIPLSGRISEGIAVLSELYKKIGPELLPQNDMWIDNLSILGAISVVHFSKVDRYEELLAKQLDGYCCAGIRKDSTEYKKAIELLQETQINTAVLIDNELLDGYVRLQINERKEIENLAYSKHVLINGHYQLVNQKFSEKQKNCLYEVMNLYTTDKTIIETVKRNMIELLDSFDPISKVRKWWNELPVNIRLSSIGRVIAHTNAKSIDPKLPDLDD